MGLVFGSSWQEESWHSDDFSYYQVMKFRKALKEVLSISDNDLTGNYLKDDDTLIRLLKEKMQKDVDK